MNTCGGWTHLCTDNSTDTVVVVRVASRKQCSRDVPSRAPEVVEQAGLHRTASNELHLNCGAVFYEEVF